VRELLGDLLVAYYVRGERRVVGIQLECDEEATIVCNSPDGGAHSDEPHFKAIVGQPGRMRRRQACG